MATRDAIVAITGSATPLSGSAADSESVFHTIGDARFVLLGEATHGTHEFYAERAAITKRLIAEHGFTAVAVEADWPDAYRVNCYVRGASDDADAQAALGGFERFPTWMWRNTVVADFVEWLRTRNDSVAEPQKAGFYGLDLYSLYGSIDAVIAYLEKVDPDAAARARDRYACFHRFEEDSQAYGYAAAAGLSEPCEDDVVAQLRELQANAADYASRDGRVAQDELFFAEQNARLVRNAEEYYRSMFGGSVMSWNLRDGHMAETLDALAAHLSGARRAKVVVWEHNSHIGDARATGMGRGGETNVGQLARERYGNETRLIGFTTFWGTVTAASDWGGEAELKRVRPALSESYEALFHETDRPRFFLPLRDPDAALPRELLERAIGVIYLPQSERVSHYFDARLPEQFDGVIHLDTTRALEPLEPTPHWSNGEAPETYPSSL